MKQIFIPRDTDSFLTFLMLTGSKFCKAVTGTHFDFRTGTFWFQLNPYNCIP